MSEWIENTKNSPGCPEHLRGVRIEADFGFYNLEFRADVMYRLWDRVDPCAIKRYRILDAEQTPMKVGEVREPSVVEPNKEQVGGDHYKSLSIQPWDAMEVWLTPEQFQGYLLGSAIKYLGRYNADKQGKGGMEDVRKAIHFLNKLASIKDT